MEFLLKDLEAAVVYASTDSDISAASKMVDKGAVWFTFSFHSATAQSWRELSPTVPTK